MNSSNNKLGSARHCKPFRKCETIILNLVDNLGIISLTIIIFDLNLRIENIDLFLCNKYVHDNRLF